MVEFLLSLVLLFAPEIAAKVTPHPTYERPVAVERAAPAPPAPALAAEVPRITAAD